jgi:hypothetical protein
MVACGAAAFETLDDGLAHLRLGLGEGERRERRKPAGGGQRILDERIRFRDFIDPAERQGLGSIISRSSKRELDKMARRHGGTHDFEGEGGKRHAHQQLRHPNAPNPTRHEPLVGAAGQHAASGDGMTVDRRDHRLWQKKHRVKRPVQNRQKLAYIVGPARIYPDEVDARRKHAALSGDYDGPDVGSAKLLEAFHQRLTQIDVERIGLAMPYGDDCNAVVGFQIDHDRLHPLPQQASAADAGKCPDAAKKEIKLPKYASWTNYDSYLPGNIERYCTYSTTGK